MSAASNIENELMTTYSELNNLLDKMSNDSNDGHMDYPATAAFNVSGGFAHAFTIKSVTSSKVILINPWFPDKDLEMSRTDFLRNSIYVTYSK